MPPVITAGHLPSAYHTTPGQMSVTHYLTPAVSAFCPARTRKKGPGVPPGPSSNWVYSATFSAKRISMAAASARVAVPCGASMPSPRPDITPSPTAHCMAGMAYSLISSKSR